MIQVKTSIAKQVLAALCAFALMLMLVPVTAQTAHAAVSKKGTFGSCTWTLETNGTLTIAPTKGASGTLANIDDGSAGSSTGDAGEQAPWLKTPEQSSQSMASLIRSVIIKPGVSANENLNGMFRSCINLTSVDLSGLNTSKTKSMKNMFLGCSKLTKLDVSKLNTANVETMSWMFKGCSSLETLDVSKLNTQNVTRMDGMFQDCLKLTSLNVSGLNTAKVTDMSNMFANCVLLRSLDVSRFNTKNATHMTSMFEGCSSLGSLDVSNFETPNVALMDSMFKNCSSVGVLDVSNFNTSKVFMMNEMFSGCRSLGELDLSNFTTANASQMKDMFHGCASLRDVTMGVKFSFKGNTKSVLTTLPDADWHSKAMGKYYTSKQIAQSRNNIADTYTRDLPAIDEGNGSNGGNSGNGSNGGNSSSNGNGGSGSGGGSGSAASSGDDTQVMYRLYNPNSGEHFYTASAYERDSVKASGWKYEGIGWTAPKKSKTPVYRLYSGTDHHYTTSAVERDSLKRAGWKYEGIGWYSDDAKGVPLYRQFNPNVDPKAPRNNSGSHNYTTSRVEHNHLVSIGWRGEGTGWYGVKK